MAIQDLGGGRTSKITTYSNVPTTNTTILNVNGSGKLNQMKFTAPTGTTGINLTLTIDGTTYYTGTVTNAASSDVYLNSMCIIDYNANSGNDGQQTQMNLPFKNNLNIQAYYTGATTGAITVTYEQDM